MSNNKKKPLVPKLRFPDFGGAEGWNEVSLGSVASLKNGYAFKSSEYVPDGPYQIITIANVQQGNLTTESTKRIAELPSDIQRHQILDLDDILISMTGNVGRVCRVTAEGLLLNQRVGKLIPEKITDTFFYQVLQREKFRDSMQLKAAGGAQGNLSTAGITDYTFNVPAAPAEQQKIADCLSSLDELIAAQARKVDALKTHKKGLMQQLFPREGETQPRLRFPEFQNAAEWQVSPLGEIFPITSSKRVHESDWTSTGVPFYRAREIVALNKQESIQPLFISEKLYSEFSKLTGDIREGHLLVTGVGSIGVPYLVKSGDRFYFKDGNIIWLKNDGEVLTGEFLLRLYETDYVQKQLKTMADVGTVATYTIDNAKRTLAAFPIEKAEQQRIASFLASLDDLINAAIQELETLKTHKKGLMQQLFPSSEDVVA